MKLKLIYGLSFIIIRIVGLFTRVKKNNVLFLSVTRTKIGGNLEMMDKIIPKDKYNKKYFLIDEDKSKFNIREKIEMSKLICSSEYILLDDFCAMISFMKVKKNQKVIQLWHGPGAYKKFGLSRQDKNPGYIKRMLTHKNYTASIVTSESVRWCYAEGFGMDINNVYATGYPRTDIFFDKKYISNVRKNFFNQYKEFNNKKIITFAPTYRGVSLAKSYYDYDKLDVDKVYKELHDDYIFIVKLHPGLRNTKEKEKFLESIKKYPDFYYDFSNYRDINDILLITDVLVTDYSSVIFDYLLVNKPIVYFAYDLDEYKNNRGLYFDLNEYIYGEISKNTNELIKSIKNENMSKDKRKIFNEKFMNSCDGNSSKRTFETFFK